MPAGLVLFCLDVPRLTRFYQAVAPLHVTHDEPGLTVLTGTQGELVLHALPPQIAATVTNPPTPREDSAMKLFFYVADLAATRHTITQAGGTMRDTTHEFEHRGLRACDATDPEGNVIQFRMRLQPA
jgi:predicted enzyme related to lactoylglutathione lyase